MEVKYGKKSKMTLEELAAQYDAEMKRREEERKQEKYERMELEGYFHSTKEMIDFVLGGGKIITEDGEWMKLIDDKIVHYKMIYNDIDLPLGMGNSSMTIEEFQNWVNNCDRYNYDSKFVNDYWHKCLDEEA